MKIKADERKVFRESIMRILSRHFCFLANASGCLIQRVADMLSSRTAIFLFLFHATTMSESRRRKFICFSLHRLSVIFVATLIAVASVDGQSEKAKKALSRVDASAALLKTFYEL